MTKAFITGFHRLVRWIWPVRWPQGPGRLGTLRSPTAGPLYPSVRLPGEDPDFLARSRIGLASVMMIWRRELGVLVNWTDILDGEIVNAAWAVAQMVAKPRTSRQAAVNLGTATWADTEELIRDVLSRIVADPEIRDLSEEEAAELGTALKRHEVQGALQALLAVRLTDAPETDAARAREAIRLALGGFWAPYIDEDENEPSYYREDHPLPTNYQAAAAAWAERLSEYFDDKISAIVASLEGQIGFAGLAQVRAEAYSARIVALLGAIERQVNALAGLEPGGRAEADWQARYRRQAHQQHGHLTPPDFDRRRRLPVDDIYVPTGIRKEDYFDPVRLTPETGSGSLKVWDLVERLDRTVLLGDPGGGKTTAANVLTDHFASDTAHKIPFLVTLREYAAETPIVWSVAECIEHNLRTLYQSPAPDGLLERLLLTGRAVVIFDGLDELPDTSRRRDVSDRVEQFCSAYPLTPALVTSRVVGYDQAQLDNTQFTCYRLGGFGDGEVTEYAHKWFTAQDNVSTVEAKAKAQAFLTESANAKDLRANPLLLSLMCILYRGAGSLPGDRTGIYEKCAELLFRKWDQQRDLYRTVRADYLVEPMIRHLAWWFYSNKDPRAAATEQGLISETIRFLHRRGFEDEGEARQAAREFIECSRGRWWIFSDVGTNSFGEKRYAFTHRTFLEYFAAWYLAAVSDTPEDLANRLVHLLQTSSWQTVGELAIQIKDRTADRGADRVYLESLAVDARAGFANPSQLLQLLVCCMPAVSLSPQTVRRLVRTIVTQLNDGISRSLPEELLAHSARYEPVIADELELCIAEMVSTSGPAHACGLRLLLELYLLNASAFWRNWAGRIIDASVADIRALAAHDKTLRALARNAKVSLA